LQFPAKRHARHFLPLWQKNRAWNVLLPFCLKCDQEGLRKLGEQFTDALPRGFVFMKLLCGVLRTLSKKLSLVPEKPPQLPAYLHHSFVVPWNIPSGDDRYSRRLGNTYNRGKYLFRGVKKYPAITAARSAAAMSAPPEFSAVREGFHNPPAAREHRRLLPDPAQGTCSPMPPGRRTW
jgi:hypothetical protein